VELVTYRTRKMGLRRSDGRSWTGGVLRRAALAAIVIAASAFDLLCSPAGAGAPAFDEYQVKAAYLYNIAKFVTWPDSAFGGPKAEFVITILGNDPFGTGLNDLLADRTVAGRRIRLERAAVPSEVKSCQLLFVSESMTGQTASIVEQTANRPVLTVSDIAGFGKSGGMITFFLEGDGVRFEVNQKSASRAGLQVSAKLLALSKITEEK
jgi:hypothetical protein